METKWTLLFFSLFLLVHVKRTLSKDELEHVSLCVLQTSCKSCLEASSHCSWCSHWEYTNSSLGKARCLTAQRLEEYGCPVEAIQLARNGSITFVENEEFQDVTEGQIPVQLRPQKVKLHLRPHSSQAVNLQFRPAKDYPLDLYYLMDLTWSMKDDKDTLVSLGGKMASTLGTLTSTVQLGFGSYADKPLMPYVLPGHENNPCKSERETCAPIYPFRHHMRLSKDVEEFISMVNASEVTGNADNLEGGMDGVVQAVVCKDQVGWTHQARKLILVATDGQMHFAGDGKLGGAVRRNDLDCHLGDNNEYSMSKVFDYPSLGQVSRLLHDHKVNLIFAVADKFYDEYKKTADLLQEKARVATLTGNSSNILDIVEKAYHEIVSKVVLRDNSMGPITLEYFSNCGLKGGPVLKTSQCEGIQEGQVYDFKVEISVGECPRNKSLWRQTVMIEDALASDASETEIEVELICGCDCGPQDDSYCNEGSNECGVCKCNSGWSGETCDCDESTGDDLNSKCIKPNETELCSNWGECVCGGCSCYPGHDGDFCECELCPKVNGIECGGKGTCNCGSCVCIDNWEGERCECPSGNEKCKVPGSNDVCSGHGHCKCGECRCDTNDGVFYRGTFCESRADAESSGLCVLYAPCVNATVDEPQDAEGLCQTNTTLYRTERVDEINTESDQYCFVVTDRASTHCMIPYLYEFSEGTTILQIGKKTCYTRLPAAVLPGGIFASVVLIGLLSLLIWKCLAVREDKRRFAQFELELQEKTVYSREQNPLYKPATTHFRVPSMVKED